MDVLTEPKVDAHCHVLDPVRFPYNPSVAYHPVGQEIGGSEYFLEVMDCYNVHQALLVGPNSGYATDNSCLLHALKVGKGRFKGIAVVPNDCDLESLQSLKAKGVIGIAFNPALMGFEYYANIEPLLKRLQSLDMWAQFQLEKDLLLDFMPMLSRVDVKFMVDHCGRPLRSLGLQQSGFKKLLEFGKEGRTVVKISGFAKFSELGYPFDDAKPFVDALAHAYGLENLVWASDWPYLRAPYRLDYGPLLRVYEKWFNADERKQLMLLSAQKHFGFN